MVSGTQKNPSGSLVTVPQATAALEGLRAELRIAILFQINDRDTLKVLVLSSRTCHTTYLRVREEVLSSILRRQYDEFLPLSEGIAAIQSKNLHMPHNKEKAIALLDSWRRSEEISSLALTSGPQPNEPTSLHEIIELLNLHKEINFFLEDYSTNAPQPPWIDPGQWPSRYLPLRLSHMEKRRFARALCRLLACQHIWKY